MQVYCFLSGCVSIPSSSTVLDGEDALQALGGHTPLAVVSGPADFVGAAGQLADHKHKDDDVEEEDQADDEKLAEVEGKSRLQEATAGWQLVERKERA